MNDLEVIKEIDIPKISKQVGFEGEPTRNNLINFLNTKCDELSAKMKVYEKKYNKGLSYLQSSFHSITEFDVIEKEDDEMKWEAYLDFYNEYSKILKQLQNGSNIE